MVTKIPDGAFSEIEHCENFNINNNQITFIEKNSLPKCTNKINFFDNKVKVIIKEAFEYGDTVQRVQMYNNSIMRIEDGSFDAMSKTLKKLEIKTNHLTNLQDDLFKGFSNLEQVDLSDNAFTYLGDQKTASSSIEPDFLKLNCQSSLSHFNPNFFSSLSNSKAALNVFNLRGKVLNCGCGNLAAFASIKKDKNKVTLKLVGSTQCTLPDGNTKITMSSPGNTNVYCEPETGKVERLITQYKDQVCYIPCLTT